MIDQNPWNKRRIFDEVSIAILGGTVISQLRKLPGLAIDRTTLRLNEYGWTTFERIRTIFGSRTRTYCYSPKTERLAKVTSENDRIVFKFVGVWFVAVAVKQDRASWSVIYTARKNHKELQELSVLLNRFSLTAEARKMALPSIKADKDGGSTVTTKWRDWEAPTLDGIPIHTQVRAKLDAHIEFLRDNWDSPDRDRHLISRGILLSGSKGSGKTSIAYAMAAVLSLRPVIFPDVATHDSFWAIAETVPVRAMVLFDDAEDMAVFKKRDPDKEDPPFENAPARPRDMFAYLSGPRSRPSVLTVVITNYPERLSETAVRTGRIKEEIKVNEVDHLGIKRFLEYTFSRKIPDDIIFPERLAMNIFDIMEDNPDYEGAITALQKETPK